MFGDPTKPRLAAGTVLSGHYTLPGSKGAAVVEIGGVADHRQYRGDGERAHAADLRQLLGDRVIFDVALDFLVAAGDRLLQ